MEKLVATEPGLAGGILPLTASLAPTICPECPWRFEMLKGFSVAMPADPSMLEVVKTRTNARSVLEGNLPKPVGPVHYESAQGCHMRVESRCRGAEHFRANVKLVSEVTPSKLVVDSEESALRVWRKRGYAY